MAEKDPIVDLIEKFLADNRKNSEEEPENEEDKLFEKNIFGEPYSEKLSEEDIKKGKIYNEFSLQHELGEFLKMKFKNDPDYSEFRGYNVQFERNVKDFYNGNLYEDKPLEDGLFVKHEMDIVIFKDFGVNSKKYAIELKFPVNKTPNKRMPHFLQDIQFMEEVKSYLKNFKTYCLTLVPNNVNGDAFRVKPKNSRTDNEIYDFFRGKETNEFGFVEAVKRLKKDPDKEGIDNPCSDGPERFDIRGDYQIEWKYETNYCFYYLLPIPDSVTR